MYVNIQTVALRPPLLTALQGKQRHHSNPRPTPPHQHAHGRLPGLGPCRLEAPFRTPSPWIRGRPQRRTRLLRDVPTACWVPQPRSCIRRLTCARRQWGVATSSKLVSLIRPYASTPVLAHRSIGPRACTLRRESGCWRCPIVVRRLKYTYLLPSYLRMPLSQFLISTLYALRKPI